jgi:hypothetical protein
VAVIAVADFDLDRVDRQERHDRFRSLRERRGGSARAGHHRWGRGGRGGGLLLGVEGVDRGRILREEPSEEDTSAARAEEEDGGEAGDEGEGAESGAGHADRLRLAHDLGDDLAAHALVLTRAGDHQTAGGRDQQGGELGDEAFADAEEGVRLEDRHRIRLAADHSHREAADDVDGDDHHRRHRVALHELRRTVHRAVEVGFLLDQLASLAGDLFIDLTGGEVGVDRHLLTGQRVQGETGDDFGDAARTVRDDDEVDDDEDKERDEADDEVAAHHEVAERLDDLACAAGAEDQLGGRDGQRQAKKRGDEQKAREYGELDGVGNVYRHEENHDRASESDHQPEIEDHVRQREDQHRDHDEDADGHE